MIRESAPQAKEAVGTVEPIDLSEVPDDITSVYNGKRCIYPHRLGRTGE
jgi:hypothetical protein